MSEKNIVLEWNDPIEKLPNDKQLVFVIDNNVGMEDEIQIAIFHSEFQIQRVDRLIVFENSFMCPEPVFCDFLRYNVKKWAHFSDISERIVIPNEDDGEEDE